MTPRGRQPVILSRGRLRRRHVVADRGRPDLTCHIHELNHFFLFSQDVETLFSISASWPTWPCYCFCLRTCASSAPHKRSLDATCTPDASPEEIPGRAHDRARERGFDQRLSHLHLVLAHWSPDGCSLERAVVVDLPQVDENMAYGAEHVLGWGLSTRWNLDETGQSARYRWI